MVEEARRPYCMQISVSFAWQGDFTPRTDAEVCSSVKHLVARTAGPMWNADVVPNDWLLPASVSAITNVDSSRLTQQYEDAAFDKVLLVGVEQRDSEFVIAAREWDRVRRELGRVATASTFDRGRIAHVISELCARVFHPLLTITEVRPDERVDLRLWAGEYPAVDSRFAQINQDDVLVVFFRYLDRQGVVQKVQEIAWTYLVVESVDRERVVCRQTSGMTRPLGTRRRRRVEMMAVRVRPQFDATRYMFAPGMNLTRPLAAHRVEVIHKVFPKDEPKAKPVSVLTDRAGSVRIGADPEQRLVWLQIYSGDVVLARIPCLPGLRPEETIPTYDDSMRLAVESELALLNSRLVDTVARRATLVIQARLAAEADKWEELDEYLAQLKALPSRDNFQQQLSAIRINAIERARADRNGSAERRIEKNCNDAAKRIDQALKSEHVQAAIEDVEALRNSEKRAAKKSEKKSE